MSSGNEIVDQESALASRREEMCVRTLLSLLLMVTGSLAFSHTLAKRFSWPDVVNNAGSPFPGFHKGYSSDIRTDTPLPGTSTSSHVVFNTTTIPNGQVLLTGAQVHGDIGNPRRDLAGLFKHVWKDVIRAPRISANNGGCPVKFIGD